MNDDLIAVIGGSLVGLAVASFLWLLTQEADRTQTTPPPAPCPFNACED